MKSKIKKCVSAMIVYLISFAAIFYISTADIRNMVRDWLFDREKYKYYVNFKDAWLNDDYYYIHGETYLHCIILFSLFLALFVTAAVLSSVFYIRVAGERRQSAKIIAHIQAAKE